MKKINILIVLMMIVFKSGYSQNWEKIYTGYNYIFRGIEFPGGQSQIAFAGGQHLTYMGNGIVIKTTNGGDTWSQLWFATQQGIEGISFPDLNTGYVCGWSHYFAKTTDGGATWTPSNPGPAADIYFYTDVKFKDALHGVVTAQTNTSAAVYSTSDGGVTWTAGTGLASIPYKICYVSDNTYFIVNNGGEIQKSTDGGLTWVTVKAGLGLLTGINFYNPMIGIATAADNSWIHKTTDGGVTWQPQQIMGTDPIWRGAAWKSQNEIVLCGTPETIYRSTDAGATWVDDYPTSSYNNALYEAVYTNDGSAFIIGSQGFLFRQLSPLIAAFTANNTTFCGVGNVQFTDQSTGSPTGWNWTFEGGTPSTSTLQNPQVTYSTPGVYDVTLTIHRGTNSNTLVKTDHIVVGGNVTAIPAQPVGPTSICGATSYTYSVVADPNATSYLWTVSPATAGAFSGTGSTTTFTSSTTWTGACTIQVAGTSPCGTGPVSPVLNVILNTQPIPYSLFTGGGYCAGQPGYEIKLEDSELGVNYQLYKDGIASGTTVPGTGNALSFGLQTVGTYTATGAVATCFANMLGASVVYIIDPAAAATQPSGSATTCNNIPSTFTSTLPANAYTLGWTLTPPSAGTISQPDVTTATVTWSTGFSGVAALTVQGQNECGNGPASPALNVTVNALPTPVVTGIATACKNQEITYTTAANSGSNYAWIATGGTITSGQGSNLVTVLWDNTGTGTVSVTETSDVNCAGISPMLIVAVNECTGISITEDDALSLYPNPASDQLNIELNAEFKTLADISIYNNLGQKVQHYSNAKGSKTQTLKIDISNLKPGVYTLRIENENQILSRLFVKR